MLHADYSRLASFANFNERWQYAHERVFNATAASLPPPFLNPPSLTTTDVATTPKPPQVDASEPLSALPNRANATFVFLCRNSDLAGVVSSIRQMEDRFNRRYGYPWVLLNEEPFTEEFKEYVVVFCHRLRHVS